MSDPALNQILPHIRSIAKEAGQIVLRYYFDSTAAQTKADGSPVTAADHASEAVILPALRHLTPNVPVISEEQHAAGLSGQVGHEFWLVDPLDGTRSFVEKTDEFTINIGLVRDGHPVLGVIYLPVKGEIYAAAGVGTAVHCAGSRDRPISVRAVPEDGLTILASRSHNDEPRLAAWLNGRRVKEQLRSSSAYKFCLLAEGKGDVYPRFGRTGEWDTAAGHAIVEAAGGSLETPDGGPLVYGKENFLNDDFIAWGRR
jgi:3'(2'), 5'-bisphosphate nucleotidase